ncbi:PGF-CTERM sorting domain-containing protein, partial [Halostella sp. PRR32]
YNYYLDAVLWRDGTVVATARSTANLAPGTGLEVDDNTTAGGEGFQASDFEATESGREQGTGTPPTETASGGTGGSPGFGAAVAVVALVAAALIART